MIETIIVPNVKNKCGNLSDTKNYRQIALETITSKLFESAILLKGEMFLAGLGSSTVDQVLKYTKYPKYIPSTSTGQVLIFFKVLKYIKYFHIKYKYKYKYSY